MNAVRLVHSFINIVVAEAILQTDENTATSVIPASAVDLPGNGFNSSTKGVNSTEVFFNGSHYVTELLALSLANISSTNISAKGEIYLLVAKRKKVSLDGKRSELGGTEVVYNMY